MHHTKTKASSQVTELESSKYETKRYIEEWLTNQPNLRNKRPKYLVNHIN